MLRCNSLERKLRLPDRLAPQWMRSPSVSFMLAWRNTLEQLLLQLESEMVMFRDTKAFSGFSVSDVDAAQKFYGDTLGLEVEQNDAGLELNIAGGTAIFAYGKENHTPATFTILNFPVADVSDAVDQLTAKGVVFEHYEGELGTDERGIFWGKKQGMGPNIAWFKDPAGNILSVIEA